MNLAVLLYQFVSSANKPVGIPDTWPAQTIELGDSTTLPGDNWMLMTPDQLLQYTLAHHADYDAWENGYYHVTLSTLVGKNIQSAIDFGKNLMIQAATDNVMLGITQAGKTGIVMEYTHELVHALITGSLYQAINIINGYIADTSTAKANVGPYITNDRLTATKWQIQDYLGLPRS